MNGFLVKLVASMRNGGSPPLRQQIMLNARVTALRAQGADASIVREAENAAQAAAQEDREVARFTREFVLPAAPTPGMALTYVGPFVFEPDSIIFNAETGQYELIEVGRLCHTLGSECECQHAVKGYLGDDRWEMISIYEPEPEPDTPAGEPEVEADGEADEAG